MLIHYCSIIFLIVKLGSFVHTVSKMEVTSMRIQISYILIGQVWFLIWKSMFKAFPQCSFWQKFPAVFPSNSYMLSLRRLAWNSKMMHFGISFCRGVPLSTCAMILFIFWFVSSYNLQFETSMQWMNQVKSDFYLTLNDGVCRSNEFPVSLTAAIDFHSWSVFSPILSA